MLCDRCRLEHREVKIAVVWSDQRVASEAAKMLCSGNTGCRARIARPVEGARNLERRQVQKVVWSGRPRVGVANEIRSREEFARTIVVIKEVEMEWAPASKG